MTAPAPNASVGEHNPLVTMHESVAVSTHRSVVANRHRPMVASIRRSMVANIICPMARLGQPWFGPGP